MNARLAIAMLAALAALGGCGGGRGGGTAAEAVVKTGFPGQVTAGGGTSGQVMARAAQDKGGSGPSGTPGIPHGSGGNTSGAAMGGTHENSALGGSGADSRGAASAASAPASR